MAGGVASQLNEAFALARYGDAAAAQAIADDIGKRFPLYTLINNVSLPMVHAAMELHHGYAAKNREQQREFV